MIDIRDLRYCIGLCIIVSISLSANDFETLLTKERQEIQQYKQKELESTYEKQRYNWINPLDFVLNYNQSQSAQSDSVGETKSAYINLNQDIFRSGGIEYSISYAQSQKNYNQIVLDQENSSLSLELFTTLLGIKNSENQIKQSELKLKNYEIEIFLKEQQYKAGDVDITLLNNALMNRNKELKILMNLKNSLNTERFDVSKLTDSTEQEINIPQFTLIQKSEFLQNNYDTEKLITQSDVLNDQYNITRTSYLPRLSFTAQYGIMDYQNRSSLAGYSGDSYTLGLQLRLPLDYNRAATLEEAKITYLKSKLEATEQKRSQNAYYKKIKSNIESYQEYIALTRKNLTLYKELIDITSKAVTLGYKAGYDLQTLQNTKSIDEYEIQINEINIQLELAKLHFMTKEVSNDK